MTQAPGHPLEDVLAYRFADSGLLARALTHTSRKQKRGDPSYERLEFLGDRVLGLLVAELLMERFPDAPEGKLAPRLAALVSGRTLAGLARNLDLASHVKVGPGEDVAGTHERDSVLADCLEAVIGAMYRDGGLDAARGFVTAQWTQLIEDVEPAVAKTDLQEWLQKRGLPLPAYEVVERTGPAHAPEFTIELTVSGRDPVRASGASKREAEQAAAAAMLELIGNDA